MDTNGILTNFSIRMVGVAFCILSFILQAKPGAASSGEMKPNLKEVRIAAFPRDPEGIDVFAKLTTQDNNTVRAQISDPLVYIDADGKVVPALAVSWEMTTPTKWKLRLRPHVLFHNGEKFDADTVKFTIDSILDPKNGSGYALFIHNIKEVTTDPKDKLVVYIETKLPSGIFLRNLNIAHMLPPNYIKEKGLEYFKEHPVGTGPFQFVKWVHGREIILDRNPNYWNTGLPKYDRLTFVIAPRKLGLSKLIQGEVNLLPHLEGRYTRKVLEAGPFKILKRSVLFQNVVLLHNRGPLAIKEVRQAINYALDREEMIKFADYGNAFPLVSLAAKGSFGANETLSPYPFDLAKARALLAKTPFKQGFKLKVVAIDNSDVIARIMKNQLKRLNIDLELKFNEGHNALNDEVRNFALQNHTRPDWDLVIFGLGNSIVDYSFLAAIFYGSTHPLSLLKSPEFDEMIHNCFVMWDQKEHEKCLKEADKFFYDEAFSIFTTQRIMTVATRKEIELQIPLSGAFSTDDTLARIEITSTPVAEHSLPPEKVSHESK